MKTLRQLLPLLLLVFPALAQGTDPLRNVSGTMPQPGPSSPWITSGDGVWTTFGGFSAHATYVSESGPEEQRNEVFSTNWLVLGAKRELGERGFFLARGRISLEPWTTGDDGYPQMLQYIPSAESPLTDRMRPRSFIGEVALQAGFRPTESTLLHIYVAPVGDPALGAAPDGLRASSMEFAEAPFAWEIQESFHSATSVVTAGFASKWITLEGSVFHDPRDVDDYTSIDDGDIDSRSVRVILTPGTNWSLQVSRGELGEDLAQRTVSSGSLTWGSSRAAASILYTQREYAVEDLPSDTAYGFELLFRASRHSFMGRAEWVDRPEFFPAAPPVTLPLPVIFHNEKTTHFTVGYLYDFLARERFRSGFGVNIDYHTQSHELPATYGHKPQSIYAFLRVRSAS